METTGIICEYDPLHLGHKKQLDMIRIAHPESGIVCLMSGNYVQRGKPAIIDKALRAKAAILCGADLVLELPVTASLSSAEGFAAAGVRILGSFCSRLSFGAEIANTEALIQTADALLSSAFSEYLTSALSQGHSFPAARQIALESMGLNGKLLESPNNILAVEYCKAIISQNLQMTPEPIYRQGNYHDPIPNPENPSATAVRKLWVNDDDWLSYVPKAVHPLYQNAAVHTISAGERAIISRLRSMTDADYQALPYGSEGLWRKLMHNARKEATLEDILTATKSKRYTRSRLDRMVMCAFLGLTEVDIQSPVPYTRVLAFNDRGRDILKDAKKQGNFRNVGEKQQCPYQDIEKRCSDLYGLFTIDGVEKPGQEYARRVYYKRGDIQ